MYFIFDKELNRVFGGISGDGRYIFENFSALDDCVRCVIFRSIRESFETEKELIRAGFEKISVHPISEFEKIVKGGN